MLSEAEAQIRQFILDEFLRGEDPEELKNDTALITDGIVDSIATLTLVSFLEQTIDIQLQAHEVDVDHLNTINDMVALVSEKQGE